MLHITNGSSAVGVIRAAGIPGEVLAWNDVLHDGPVPEGVSFNQLRAIRARFISDSGWRPFDEALREFTERDRALERSLTHDEVVLWFEHDLYDQLQLLQLMDWFATCELGATRLSLICNAEYLGASTPQRLATRFPERTIVTDEQFERARAGWRAFRASDPTAVETFARTDSSALPFLNAAFARHLEQFPSTANGLSRTEQYTLEILAAAPRKFGSLFVESQSNEDAIYLGDASFARYLASLSHCEHPLVLTADGQRISSIVTRAESTVELALTAAGHRVLAKEADHVTINGIDRWLGGVQLIGAESPWRWDPSAKLLVAT